MRYVPLLFACVLHTVTAIVVEESFTADPLANNWKIHGAHELFVWDDRKGVLQTTWDSSLTNSFFYYQFTNYATRHDSFSARLSLNLQSIQIGTTPGKPYTFQMAFGFINTTNAFDPQMFRGTGINAVHGPRNLVEFTYFPDSGFGATVAPTIITDKNQIYFSGNYPLEMLGGEQYEIELKFDPTQQTLYTTLIRNGESLPLKPLHFSASETDFVLNAFALSSYSDAGQSSQFSGSIRAEAQIDTIRLLWPTVPVPSLSVILQEADLLFSFTAEKGWLYSLQSSVDFIRWEQLKEISVRENGELKVLHPFEPGAARFFRLHLRKPIIGR